MMFRRVLKGGFVFALVGAALVPACSRRKPAEVNDITPSVKVNRLRAPLGSPIEVTYTWTVGPNAKKVGQDYRAFLHFLDSHNVLLIAESHLPSPPPSTWEAGKTYSYTLTHFIPVYPYVGDVEVRMGLYPPTGRGERPALKGDDAGMREYRVAKMEFLPQTENIFLVYKEGWHNPETQPDNPNVERTWTKKEALVSFKNPKKDIVIYLRADTSPTFFSEPPVLRVSVANRVGVLVPIQSPEVFSKKVRVKAADLGDEEWVDVRLAMNQSFVPKLLSPPLNNDDRELGLLVYSPLYVGEADKIGPLSGPEVMDAGPLPAAAAKAPAAKAAPAAAKKP